MNIETNSDTHTRELFVLVRDAVNDLLTSLASSAASCDHKNLQEDVGILLFFLQELHTLGILDLRQVKQFARDQRELLAANPEMCAPYVVLQSPETCEHQYIGPSSEGADEECRTCHTVFLGCPACTRAAGSELCVRHAEPLCP